jgi:hypothetical protein
MGRKKLDISDEERKKRSYEYHKKWTENNKEKMNKYRNNWIENNKDKNIQSKKEWEKRNYNERKEYSKLHRLKILPYRRIKQKEYSIKYPEKVKAHHIARVIPLKESCEICGSKDNLEKHHWNYNKPLLVNTLCVVCHKIQHIKHFKDSVYGGEEN